MARHAMRNPTGRWSLNQIAAEAGITYRTARTLAASGYLNPDDLDYKDVALARVAAALLDAPRPAGQNRTEAADALTKRNFDALALARKVIDDPRPSDEATLAVLPHDVRLAPKAFALMGLIAEHQGLPLLLLPIGAWVIEANDLAAQMRGAAS